MEIENQRLKRMIAEAEGKLKVLGGRLVKLAKNGAAVGSRNPSSTSSLEDRTVK